MTQAVGRESRGPRRRPARSGLARPPVGAAGGTAAFALVPCPDFSLRNTLECGQFFRWSPHGRGYRIHTHGRVFEAVQERDILRVSGVDGDWAKRFFALDHDLRAIRRSIGRDPFVRRALGEFPGLRILRQDPYECTLGFLLSICSNIPRISRDIGSLAELYGRRGALPGPDVPFDESRLRTLKIGFRARYLVSAQRSASVLERLAGLADDEAREALMGIDGIAEKVADCILLFAYGRLGVFPVDTWIRKTMRKVYFQGARVPDRRIREFASSYFGPWAGYAQEYLYAWARRHGAKGLAGYWKEAQ